MGCAALARNIRFNLTEAQTRWGIQTAIQGINQSPITGLLGCAYTPETAVEAYFQSILLFDAKGALQIEDPTGTGRTRQIADTLFTPPQNAHMLATQAYNRAWMAFSDLKTPKSFCAAYDLKSGELYPYGMKPVGFGWYAGAEVAVGECCTPSTLVNGVTVATGNGHLYRCIQAGTLGANQPVWPTTDGGTVNDGTAIWQEHTPVLANRLPAPDAPALTRVAGAGTFPASRDVYVVIAYTNQQGETIASVSSKIVNTVLNDEVQVAIPALAALPSWMQGLSAQYIPTGAQVYEADVVTGSAAPSGSTYQQVAGGPFALGATASITDSATSGIYPPTTNTARVTGGQLPTPDVAPTIQRSSSGGSFAAGLDVYVTQTYKNASGETLPGPASSITDTQLDDGISVTVAFPVGYSLESVGLYVCAVPTGTVFGGSEYPPFEQFSLFGYYASGATPTIGTAPAGAPPPTANTTGTAGNIAQDTPLGGLNATQGYRYAALAFLNQFDTISGIVQAAVVSYDVDENGWELGVFNVPTGPAYIKQRIVGFTVADGTSAGPFYYIPTSTTSDGIQMTATVLPDNVTSSATFNFTDDFLIASQDITDRLRVIAPQEAVDIYYSPATDRIFQTGVPGYYSGHWASLAADPESYYGDTGLISVGTDDGERAWCVREFRGVPYSLRERSGFEIKPSTGDPSTWAVNQRWSKVGPCGPRAVDVCGDFMIFIHFSGIYLYDGKSPTLVSKEIPRWWNTINWQAAQYIWCHIDEYNHEVHMGFPVGGSTVPNVRLVLNYEEGWNNPLFFSRFSGKEITVEQARKYSVDDIAGYLCQRVYRAIPGVPVPVEGPVNTDEMISQQTVSQLLIASSSPDGTVQAVTPGVFNDNGQGIDSQYEGISVQQMMSLGKLAGINLNVRGNGKMTVSFLPGGKKATDWHPGDKDYEVKLRPVDLTPDPSKGISRPAPARLNERWRPRFTNGKVPDAWFAIKMAVVYVTPMFQGRESGENV